VRHLYLKKEYLSSGERNFLPGLPSIFTRSEERKIFQRLEKKPDNFEIKKEIAVRNLRLVNNIAKRLNYLWEDCYLEIGDALGYGVLGLYKAIDLFDWRKGYKFSTYASAWIYQYIRYFLKYKNFLIGKPHYYVDCESKRRRLSEKINQELMAYANDNELLKRKIFSKKKIEKMKEINFSIISLDSFLTKGNGEERTVLDISGVEEKGYRIVEEKDNRRRILSFLEEHLNKREKLILEKRIGLKDDVTWTLAEIGRLFHVSRERIRQIQNKAIEKIKKAEDKSLLKQLLT
jgi:RNA polymerase primary sigma factor